MPGPLPKRSEDRLRRNKDTTGVPTDKYDLDGEVEIPHAYFFNPLINDLWLALRSSVNARFFEPTDWAYAKLTLSLMEAEMGQDPEHLKIPKAMMMANFDAMMSKLLLTEADRRKLRIEVTRGNQGQQAEEGRVINAQQAFKDRFEKQREA